MDKVLKKHKLPQVTQYKIDHLNNLKTSNEIKFIIKKKSPGPDVLTEEFYPITIKSLFLKT